MSFAHAYEIGDMNQQLSFLMEKSDAIVMLPGCQKGSLEALTEGLDMLVVFLSAVFILVSLFCLFFYRWFESAQQTIYRCHKWWVAVWDCRAAHSAISPHCNGSSEERLNALLSVSSDSNLPNHGVRHLAVIMDGNRRYGKRFAQSATTQSSSEALLSTCESLINEESSFSAKGEKLFTLFSLIQGTAYDGHRLGGEKLLEFIEYAMEFHVEILTVYAFSKENWSRPLLEVNVLMALFAFYFERIRQIAEKKGIFVRFVSSSFERIPLRIRQLMIEVETESRRHSPRHMIVNVCVSYSGQDEITQACNRLVNQKNTTAPFSTQDLMLHMLRSITQEHYEDEDKAIFSSRGGVEPQLLFRTSGEQRLSNFLLFESAYTEFCFSKKTWPEVTKSDLMSILLDYSSRNKRLGK